MQGEFCILQYRSVGKEIGNAGIKPAAYIPECAAEHVSQMQCFVGCFRAWFAPEPNSKLPDLRILSVNDVYKPERLALVRTVARAAADPGVLVKQVLPGDLLGGSLYASEHLGESTVDVLNSLGVDYCLLGNHEFDYGEERLRELMDKSRFPWLGSNVRDRGNAQSSIFHTTLDSDTFWVQSSHGPVLCGLFGLCTPATPQLSDPGHNISFEDPISHARRPCEWLLLERAYTRTSHKPSLCQCPLPMISVDMLFSPRQKAICQLQTVPQRKQPLPVISAFGQCFLKS